MAYLDPVVARLSMNIGDFAAQVAKAKALIKSLEGTLQIKTDGLDQAAAKVAALSKSLQNLSGTVKVNADGLTTLAAKTTATATATTAATGIMVNGWRMTGTMIHWVIAGGAELLAVTLPAIVALGAGLAVMAQGAQMVQQHMQAVQIATSATDQMFGQTAGSLIGLKNSLKAAQDAANPSVYGVLGSAIITVNEHFGGLASTGLQVAQMFQTFAARVALDFAPGGALGDKTSALLAHMTSDLQGLGQVAGNTGHALVNFASAMPGLAELLLKMLSGITGLASSLLGLAGPLITVVMLFEEFNRWGGLMATGLARIGLASTQLEGGVFSLARFASVVRGFASVAPMAVYGLSALASRFTLLMGTLSMGAKSEGLANLFGSIGIGAAKATGSIGGFAAKLEGVIAKIGPFQAALIVGAAVALGIVIDKLVTAKSAAQQFGDSLQAALMKTSNVNAFQAIIGNISQLNTKLATAPLVLNGTAQEMMRFGNAAQTANPAIGSFNAAIRQQQQDLINVSQGAAYLARTYGTTLVGAMALADMANVKLVNGITGSGQAAQIARMQIASLVQGYIAMGQPAGAVGADMTALAIQSGLASSNVGKLNQAWDQFMQGMTGGTSALATFTQDLTNLTTGTNNAANVLGKTKSISLNIQDFASSLKTFSGNGATAWQNFDRVVGTTAPQLIDWLRTAGAEGAVSGDQFSKAVLGMVSSLVPLASQSQTAQAEVLGLVHQVIPSITTWGQLTQTLKGTHASLKDTTSTVQTATQKMGDMSKVAQNLGNVLQTALLTALSSAKVAASGAGAAMQTYQQDIMNAGTSVSKTAGDRARLISDLEKLGYTAKQAAQLIDMVSGSLNRMPTSKTITITTNLVTRSISTGGNIPAGVRAKGYASGTSGASPGWAWVGEAGPELVRFRGGEPVVPNHVATGYAGGAGIGGDQHIHLYIDGREIHAAVSKQAVATQRRTGHNGMQKRTR